MIFAWLSSSWALLTVEDCSNQGRIDISVDTEGTIYLIEFKQAKALEQLKAKGYAEKSQAKGKRIVLIGIGFSSEERNITEFAWELA